MKTYNAVYNPKLNKGVYGISLVENPAMEGLFIALSKDENVQLKTVDAEQRILMGLVLEPNKPIYRNQNGEEFNIVFNEQTIKELSYGFFKSNSHSNSTVEHDVTQKIEGVTFTESWIVENPDIDKSTNFGFNYPKGSWVAVMKVDSEEIWNGYVKNGKVQGFSIDALLSLEEVNLKSNIEMTNTNTLLEKILLALSPKKEAEEVKEAEVKLGSIMLLDGSLKVEYDGEELVEGIATWIMAEDGTKVPTPVGEHPLEDGTILVVETEGIVKEVKQAEAPAEEEAPASVAEMAEEVSNDAKIASEIESAIKSILIKYEAQEKDIILFKAQVVELKAQIEAIGKQPSEKPIKNTTKIELTQKRQFSNLLTKINNQ